jgi:hypothetical protein
MTQPLLGDAPPHVVEQLASLPWIEVDPLRLYTQKVAVGEEVRTDPAARRREKREEEPRSGESAPKDAAAEPASKEELAPSG